MISVMKLYKITISSASSWKAESRGLEVLFTKAAQTLARVFVHIMHHRTVLPSVSFAPLHHLQKCHIHLPLTKFVTDDSDLRRLQSAWPLLQKLELNCCTIEEKNWCENVWEPLKSYSADQSPSYHSVVDFIWDHPRLQTLKLSFVTYDIGAGPAQAVTAHARWKGRICSSRN